MKKAVITNQLKKKFPVKNGFYEAVRGVDLEVMSGEIFGFLGPNGAGKTTTLRMLTTLLSIDSGDAYVAGFNVQKQPNEVRKRIGYVSQKGGADGSATGRENLFLQGRLYGMSKDDVITQSNILIKRFLLEDFIDRFVSTYSGGQRRRLDIALGMMQKPEILFLDEPTTGLDLQNRANLWDQVRLLKEMGVTVFLTSHYLEEVDFLSDRLAIMDQGKVVIVGTSKELKKQISGDVVTIGFAKNNHHQALNLLKNQSFIREISEDKQHIRLYVEHGEAALPHILRLIDAEKIPLETISLSIPTLNDVFLKKTGRSLNEQGISL